jgi:hypothetical protein
MNNDELLHTIGDLILASEQRIRQDMATKADIEANNKVIGTIVRTELASLKQGLVKLGEKISKRLKAQDDAIEEMKNNLLL